MVVMFELYTLKLTDHVVANIQLNLSAPNPNGASSERRAMFCPFFRKCLFLFHCFGFCPCDSLGIFIVKLEIELFTASASDSLTQLTGNALCTYFIKLCNNLRAIRSNAHTTFTVNMTHRAVLCIAHILGESTEWDSLSYSLSLSLWIIHFLFRNHSFSVTFSNELKPMCDFLHEILLT